MKKLFLASVLFMVPLCASDKVTTIASLIEAKKQRIEKELQDINQIPDENAKHEKLKEFIKSRTLHLDPDAETIYDLAKKQNENVVQMGVGGATVGVKAGFWTGKILVSLIGHGTIGLIVLGTTAVAGPTAGWAMGVSLETSWGPTIEVVSTKVGLVTGAAGGVTGAVVTGPA